MCRHLAYLGPATDLRTLLYAPPHSLERQAYEPRLNLANTLNADGFGAGWYPPGAGPSTAGPSTAGAGHPVRYRSARPMWHDTSFRDIARAAATRCALAAVRSATPGFPVDESCAQPLRCEKWLFSHNGRVDDYAAAEEKLRALAGDPAAVPEARAPLDSAALFALAVRAWRGGRSLAAGLADTVRATAELAAGRYNLLAADGTALAATAFGDSLYTRDAGGALTIASEPCDDDPAWQPVPDRTLVTADARHGIRLHPL